jgi:hypothetical protein
MGTTMTQTRFVSGCARKKRGRKRDIVKAGIGGMAQPERDDASGWWPLEDENAMS